MNKKERVIYEFEVDFKKCFICSNLTNDDIISYRPGLKTGVEIDIFWWHLPTKNSQEYPPPRASYPPTKSLTKASKM